mmetsp:Transcript_28932/g.53428  ORF Transcript_28932/g.53428 Transcript_28932/m.53428 type:complete len:108 (-) Transcript_28932:594-917(-)
MIFSLSLNSFTISPPFLWCGHYRCVTNGNNVDDLYNNDRRDDHKSPQSILVSPHYQPQWDAVTISVSADNGGQTTAAGGSGIDCCVILFNESLQIISHLISLFKHTQ